LADAAWKTKMKANASSAVSLSPLVDHVVIIVKENHTYDNYFGTFPNSEGANTLTHEPDPPNVSPNHQHQTWMNRDQDQRYHVQATSLEKCLCAMPS
jgi:phospholipase C